MKKNKIFCSFSRGEDFCVVLESAGGTCFGEMCEITYNRFPEPSDYYFNINEISEVVLNYKKHVKGERIVLNCRTCKYRFKCYTSNIHKAYLY